MAAAAAAVALVTYQIKYLIRGHHVYPRIKHLIWYFARFDQAKYVDTLHWWKLSTLHEHDNQHDRFAMAILEEGTECIVGHLPREISCECYYFLNMDGIIDVEVTAKRNDQAFLKEA